MMVRAPALVRCAPIAAGVVRVFLGLGGAQGWKSWNWCIPERSGELYADGDDIIMSTSNRVSVYDVVLPTPIPGKGQMLTQLSLWWFGQLSDVIPNHVISGTDVPEQWAGRAVGSAAADAPGGVHRPRLPGRARAGVL